MDGEVSIAAGGATLHATFTEPDSARGVIVFAHGSGSGRHSPRNQFVARALNAAGFATLLADLLTAEEDRIDARTRAYRFDIGLLATRVVALIDWVSGDAGLFGASTGAAAALIAAADRPEVVRAVVSRGGRPDLAGAALSNVKAPTLLIVGGHDTQVIGLNEQALDEIRSEKRLDIVPGATHLFEEPAALERVAELAATWFTSHL